MITNQNNNVDVAVRRYNDTITILGSRGSGKTSFLMSILKQYEKNDDVEIIELIDPTLIEEKGHIFLTLISLIKISALTTSLPQFFLLIGCFAI